MQELLDDVMSVDFIVAQNLKFELQWLKRCGLELRDVLGYDTMLAEWVLDGNKKSPRDLASLAKKYGVPGKVDLVNKFIKAGVATRDIHPKWLLEYCYADVEATRMVFEKQAPVVSECFVWHLVHVRNLTCSVLADIEFEGLQLDTERVMEEYRRVMKIKEELGAKLAEMTGGINLNSGKQFAAYLYGVLGMKEALDWRGKPIRTKGGDASTNAKVLALLKPETDKQREFLDLYKTYNKVVSLLEKNLDYFKRTCEEKGGVFRGNIQQNVVQTHRLASSGIPVVFAGMKKAKKVQLQNIPREYKKLFWSGDEDWDIFEPDGSQLEFRVAVDLGNDEVGLAEKAKDRRQESKKHTFRPLYGGSSGSPALVAYCEYFKDKYKGISETQRGWALKCVDKKQFTTPYGMTFYFPDTKMNKRGYINNTTSIYNYPVQGFATGEIIPIAMVYFWHRTRDIRLRIFCTIHDSIAAKVHKDDVELAKAAAKQALTYDVYEFLHRVYNYDFHVPLGLGSKIGKYWSEGPEEKWDVWPDGRELKRE
jgi:DNA polymerase I-like protein with 3'-5' exonuclease and polymerase domains